MLDASSMAFSLRRGQWLGCVLSREHTRGQQAKQISCQAPNEAKYKPRHDLLYH